MGELRCLRCGAMGVHMLDLSNLSEIMCAECNEIADIADLREEIEAWSRTLAIIDVMRKSAEAGADALAAQ